MASKTVGELPTRQQILDFIQESPTPVGKREIARAFRIKGALRNDLKALLREMEEDGALDRGRKRRLAPKGALPEVAVIQATGQDFDGELLARPTGASAEEDIRIVIVADARTARFPRAGDLVLARMRRTGEGHYEALPIRILKPAPSSLLAVVRKGRGGLRLVPTDRRQDREYAVRRADAEELEDGTLVMVRPMGGQRGMHEAEVVERLGAFDDPGAFSLIAIHKNGIPVAFPEAALKEAEAAKPVDLGKREDLRDTPLVTIDGADARDFDDAVWAEPDPDPANPDGHRITVAIADVAHYVRPGGALDAAARQRGNSVYFPDRVVPMLPERLSNDLCSLKPGEDRACLAVRMTIDAQGRLKRHRFVRGLMRSAARLTYEQVQQAQDGAPDETTAALMDSVIRPLYAAFASLEAARRARGTLDLDIPEREVELDRRGRVVRIASRMRLDAHRVIEEFMICANVAAAEALEAKRAPAMYRIHDTPPPDKLEALRESLAGLGFALAKGAVTQPRLFTGILAQAHGTEKAQIVSDLVLRSQSQAAYAPENIGHFGLALRRYCHFTSPIRRYADLLVHRSLIAAWGLGEGGLPTGEAGEFAAIGEAISEAERRAVSAEREAKDRYVTAFMADRVGAEFEGRISGVARFGLFVTLTETGADGLVPVSTLPPDRYVHDEVHHRLVGEHAGLSFALGRPVTVRLAEANLETGGLVMEVTGGGETLKPSEAAKALRGRRGGRRAGAGPRKGGRGNRGRR